jgi:hypothetical protein
MSPLRGVRARNAARADVRRNNLHFYPAAGQDLAAPRLDPMASVIKWGLNSGMAAGTASAAASGIALKIASGMDSGTALGIALEIASTIADGVSRVQGLYIVA